MDSNSKSHRIPMKDTSVKTGAFYPDSELGKYSFTTTNATDQKDLKTFPSLISDGMSGCWGVVSIIGYVLIHLAAMSVTMSAAIIFHTKEGVTLTGDGLVQGACWVMTILAPILVVVTLLSAWSPFCKDVGIPIKYPYLNQLLLGGFLVLFVATFKLQIWMLMREYQAEVKQDISDAKAAYNDVDPSGLIPAALYLQCIVLGFTILNPVAGIAKHVLPDPNAPPTSG